MKKFLLPLFGLAALSACTTSNPKTVSTIPWQNDKKLDPMVRTYGYIEDDTIYTAPVNPAPKSNEKL